MNSASKACARSLSRMSSSITQSRSLTVMKACTSASISNPANAELDQVPCSASSSSRTLCNFCGSLMRCDLMRRMVILSSSSPGEMGTLISFFIAASYRTLGEFCLRDQGIEFVNDLLHFDQVHD